MADHWVTDKAHVSEFERQFQDQNAIRLEDVTNWGQPALAAFSPSYLTESHLQQLNQANPPTNDDAEVDMDNVSIDSDELDRILEQQNSTSDVESLLSAVTVNGSFLSSSRQEYDSSDDDMDVLEPVEMDEFSHDNSQRSVVRHIISSSVGFSTPQDVAINQAGRAYETVDVNEMSRQHPRLRVAPIEDDEEEPPEAKQQPQPLQSQPQQTQQQHPMRPHPVQSQQVSPLEQSEVAPRPAVTPTSPQPTQPNRPQSTSSSASPSSQVLSDIEIARRLQQEEYQKVNLEAPMRPPVKTTPKTMSLPIPGPKEPTSTPSLTSDTNGVLKGPSRRGMLLKQSSVGSHWKARQFVLENNQFVYGTHQQEVDKQGFKLSRRQVKRKTFQISEVFGINILGLVPLHRSWSVFERDDIKSAPLGFPFELHDPDPRHRSYLFDCETAELRNGWINDLRHSIECLEKNHLEGRGEAPLLVTPPLRQSTPATTSPHTPVMNTGRCGQCQTVFAFPAGSTKVKCGSCSSINRIPVELQRGDVSPTMKSPSHSGTKAKCGSCQTTLLIPEGHRLVRCGSCGSVVRLPEPSSTPTAILSSRSNQQQKNHVRNLEQPESDITIGFESLRLGKQLHESPFSVTYEAELNGEQVALVQPTRNAPKFMPIATLKQIHQANLCSVHGFTRDNAGRICLVAESSPLGSLQDVLQRESKNLSTQVRLGIALQICEAMEQLHSVNLIHGMLSPPTIYLWEFHASRMGNVQLKVAEYYYKWAGFPVPAALAAWCAPEILAGGPLTYASDIWAFGVTLWQIFEDGKTPYATLRDFVDIKQAVVNEAFRLPSPSAGTPAVNQLMQLCFSEPSKRPPFSLLRGRLWDLVTGVTTSGQAVVETPHVLKPSSIRASPPPSFISSPVPERVSPPSQPQPGWQCGRCTYINNPTESDCAMCSNPSKVPPSAQSAKTNSTSNGWTCKTCTYLNNQEHSVCLMCETTKQ